MASLCAAVRQIMHSISPGEKAGAGRAERRATAERYTWKWSFRLANLSQTQNVDALPITTVIENTHQKKRAEDSSAGCLPAAGAWPGLHDPLCPGLRHGPNHAAPANHRRDVLT